MLITDITPEQEVLFFQCLEDWSDDMRDAGVQRQQWFYEMRPKGLRVKLAFNDAGILAGFIQYIPLEHSIILGQNGFFIYCIWVHGHNQGRGNQQKQGLGSALLKAAEDDAKAHGAVGMAAWGLMLPIWMKASWFKQKGYKKVDRVGISLLLWKDFSGAAAPPKWRKPLKKPQIGIDKVDLSIFTHGWCSVHNILAERVKRIAASYPGIFNVVEYNTRERSVLEEWGISDAVFLDGKEHKSGPPPSYKKLKKLMEARLKKRRLI